MKMENKKEKVLVLGASSKSDRYSYIAAQMLLDYGHNVYAFGNRNGTIGSLKIETNWPESQCFDTVTMYVNPKRQIEYMDKIIELKPLRVIFNPGTENEDFYEFLKENDIQFMEACTLIMLRTNQF